MSRIELPDEGWAILAAPRKVSERKRRRYIAAMTDLSSGTASLPQVIDGNGNASPDPRHFGSEQMALADAVGDTLILCLVKQWSFGEVTAEILADLPTDAFDAVFKACRDLAPDIMPDYSPDPDPKACTGVSPPTPPPSSMESPTFATPSSAGTS